MYTTVRDLPATLATPQRRLPRLAGTVLALGTVSLLTDVSSEMITAVLPVYLTLALGLTPLAFGVLDGLYQGVSVLVRLAGGYAADRLGRPKATAQVGYGLSALCKLGLLAFTGPTGIGAVLAVDRTGKGLRTAPRDALISAAVPPEALGRAFGVHRTMDTIGALTGPLLAFAMLLVLPGDYHSIFLTSFVFAALGVAVLATFVRERPRLHGQPLVQLSDLRGLLLDRKLLRVAGVSAVLGLLTVSDGFLYLQLRAHHAVNARYFPLLFVGTAAVYLLLALPLGRLADRFGRVRVLVAGHGALLVTYVALLSASAVPAAVLSGIVLLGLGIYYAATDGVLAAIAASLTGHALRGSGIALVQTAVAAGRLFSAVLFGLLWTVWDQQSAMLAFALTLAVALPVTWRVLRAADRPDAEGVEDVG
jgi:MFS family permease